LRALKNALFWETEKADSIRDSPKPTFGFLTASLHERSLHHGGVANKAMNGAVFRSLILLSRRGRIKEGS
jgi:hypothetical protein